MTDTTREGLMTKIKEAVSNSREFGDYSSADQEAVDSYESSFDEMVKDVEKLIKSEITKARKEGYTAGANSAKGTFDDVRRGAQEQLLDELEAKAVKRTILSSVEAYEDVVIPKSVIEAKRKQIKEGK